MLRGLIIATTIFMIWEFCCAYFDIPTFMLPPPSKVFISIYTNWDLLPKLFIAKILSNVVLPKIILTNINIPEIPHAIRAAKYINYYPLTT